MKSNSLQSSLRVSLTAFVVLLLTSVPAMSYEEPKYTFIMKTDVYEIRRYEKRTVAQVTYDEEDSGFRVLFDYISGANKNATHVKTNSPVTQSIAINMTVPVTQSKSGNKTDMRFFLPHRFSKKTAPEPTDKRVSIIDLPEEYFAVILYSGFASESNFKKHQQKLKLALKHDGLEITGLPLKATYNSPFTPPFLRRNEAMYPINWNLPPD